jgi:hypothetical protein
MHTHSKAIFLVASLCVAGPLLAQDLPPDLQGSWDVSIDDCRRSGTSVTQIDISADTINSFGGDATVSEISGSGPVIFVAAEYLQVEGVEELGERQRVYFRLTQRDGRDKLNLVWKDVQTVDLVRCDDNAAANDDAATAPEKDEVTDGEDSALPIPIGLWVVAGVSCDNPANAVWRVYDGRGLKGAQSTDCEITKVVKDGSRYIIDQTCVASYDGSRSSYQDSVEIQAPKRFGLVEGGETEMLVFNWCGSRLQP